MNQEKMNEQLWDWLYLFHPQLVSKFLEFYSYKQALERKANEFRQLSGKR